MWAKKENSFPTKIIWVFLDLINHLKQKKHFNKVKDLNGIFLNNGLKYQILRFGNF